MRQNRRYGFTLLELLLVVIVVGILATISIPTFGRMANRAKATEAQNQVSTILTAELVYYQENDNFTTTGTDLLVSPPKDNATKFNYTFDGVGSTSTVTATGRAAAGTSGITVIGTVNNHGVKSQTTTGI